MVRKLLALALSLGGLLLIGQAAYALIIAPPPGPVRIVQSDAVFVGKVIAIEPQDVDAKPFPGAKETVKYRIAVVSVSQAVKGMKDEKMVRVGFVPPVPRKPGLPISSGSLRNTQLQIGQEGLFMINKHSDGKFYQAPQFGYFVSAQDKSFTEEVNTAKKVVTVMANPLASLKSKDYEERLLAASIQISKHRTQKPPFRNQQEPIDAEESKLILDTLMANKWQPGRFGQTNGYQLFLQLGVGPQDGWKGPNQIKDIDEVRVAFQGWLKDNPNYRIKRFVSASDK
jgi:hypothetical protein